MNIKHILVPVDFSEFSDIAVEYALFLAENYNAHIRLMHTILLFQSENNEVAQLNDYKRMVEQKEHEVQQQFSLHLKKAKQNHITIKAETEWGFSAPDTILDYINDNNFDVVIMGTHGRTGLKKWVYGSVAEKIVRLSPTPVLTTHHSPEKFVIEKILVPVDFSDYSQDAINHAIQIAQQFNSEINFLHVIEQQVHPAFYAGHIESIFAADPELENRSITNLQKFTEYDHLKNKIRKEKLNANYFVTSGSVHKEILEFSKKNNIDLIIMGTRGLTGLDHLLIGSSAERVVRLSEAPVLTVSRHQE